MRIDGAREIAEEEWQQLAVVWVTFDLTLSQDFFFAEDTLSRYVVWFVV